MKWPDQELHTDQFFVGKNFLNNFKEKSFFVHFNGLQIHRDGCVVARGLDLGAKIRKCRLPLIKDGKIPVRQSNWAHVPLGRILEPFNDKIYNELNILINKTQMDIFHSEMIKKVSLVH